MDEQPPINTPPYLDKALWLVVLTPICLLLSQKLGISLSAGEITGLLLPIIAYVVMHKFKTAKLQAAQIAAAVDTDAKAVAILNTKGPQP